MKYKFLPQTVPAYAATEQFNELRKKHPDYTTRKRRSTRPIRATVPRTGKPTSSTSFRIDVDDDRDRRRARYAHRPHALSLAADPDQERRVPDVPQHGRGRAQDDDRSLRATANGFGWKMDEVIGAQIVSVPMTVPIERANKTFTAFMGSLAAVFLAIFVLLNVMLYTMVIRRVTNLAGIADQVSLGNVDAGEFKTSSTRRDRRADRGDGPHEGEPRAGDEDAGRMMWTPTLATTARSSLAAPRGGASRARGGPSRDCDRAHAPRQVRDRERPGQGRDGHRLQGVRPAHRAARRDQDDPQGPGRPGRGAAIHGALQERGEGRGAAACIRNIVAVYEYGEDDTVAFIAMEYVEGAGLREYLNRRETFDFAQLVALMRQLLEALDFAHAKRRRPSRHQAVQSHRHRGRAAQGRRLRHRARRHDEPHAGGDDHRHAVVHVARAVPRPADATRARTCSAWAW